MQYKRENDIIIALGSPGFFKWYLLTVIGPYDILSKYVTTAVSLIRLSEV